MSWYWIVLIVLGYFLILYLVDLVLYRIIDFDEECSIVAAMFWPITVLYLILILPFYVIHEFVIDNYD